MKSKRPHRERQAAPSKNGRARIDPITQLHQELDRDKARLEAQKGRQLTYAEERRLQESAVAQVTDKELEQQLLRRINRWEKKNDLSGAQRDPAAHW